MSDSGIRSLTGWLIDSVTLRVGALADDGPVLRALDESDQRTQQLIAKLQISWEILERISPVHTRWLRRFVNRVVLVPPLGPRASYRHRSRSVFLRDDSGVAHDALGLAAILAHEGTHARLCAHFGSRLMLLQTRARVEHRCVTEQLAVLRAGDPQHYLVEWSQELLTRYEGKIDLPRS